MKFITQLSQLHLLHIPLASYLCVSTVVFYIGVVLQCDSTLVCFYSLFLHRWFYLDGTLLDLAIFEERKRRHYIVAHLFSYKLSYRITHVAPVVYETSQTTQFFCFAFLQIASLVVFFSVCLHSWVTVEIESAVVLPSSETVLDVITFKTKLLCFAVKLM